MTYLGGKIECECGKWISEHLKKCPTCGAPNEEKTVFTYHCEDCGHVESSHVLEDTWCAVCENQMTAEDEC